ncbi:hypothetical protein Cflav_PD1013 [Pedosphaera parvula Ellin514]|uniref:Sulfotransferase n=2 Tax=Pedosphaera TaxID=1032526 RepID=B9XPE5_PEDPL|nr:hypothetical protein Cflav_PD1013 [Pedosphaera parvula Ellin514]
MGNKRSGTSLLVRLLNLHPEMFASHESDILWILYQARNEWPRRYQCYPWDGPLGMNKTLQDCAHIFNSSPSLANDGKAIFNTFCRVEEHLRRLAAPTPPASSIKWVGDKKPVQQSDPELRPFIEEHFPDARYLHIVRHPRAVIASKLEAVKTWPVVPEFWKKRPEFVLDRWALHEDWVLQAKATMKSPIHTLRFEDLCSKPIETMEGVFAFFGLNLPGEAANFLVRDVKPDPNKKYDSFLLPHSNHARRIMELYQYS